MEKGEKFGKVEDLLWCPECDSEMRIEVYEKYYEDKSDAYVKECVKCKYYEVVAQHKKVGQ